ncbi:MAG: ZIP family metal transporter [Spirochaetes bacterium]|nr:ZIP family metal transporter [Spirochaetota bacterium]
MTQIIVFIALAGIGGMALGGLVSVIMLRKPSEKITCWMMSFAAGVMVSIVFFGLLPETLELASVAVSIFGLVLGIVVIMALNRIVDRIAHAREEEWGLHHTHEGFYHADEFIKSPKALKSGVLLLIAIALHNIPEGMAIGAGGTHDYRIGSLLALMIALHNIPEGMAVAAPLLAGNINRWKVLLITALCGSTTLIGGFVGILIGGVSDFAVALSLSAAGGAMLYIVFGEMIPLAAVMTKTRTASVVTLFGIIVGMFPALL